MPEEVVLSTILGVLIIPKFGQLFYHWSVFFLPRWDISPRTLK